MSSTCCSTCFIESRLTKKKDDKQFRPSKSKLQPYLKLICLFAQRSHISVTSQSLQIKGRFGSASDYPLTTKYYANRMVQRQSSLWDTIQETCVSDTLTFIVEGWVSYAFQTYAGKLYLSFSAVVRHLWIPKFFYMQHIVVVICLRSWFTLALRENVVESLLPTSK